METKTHTFVKGMNTDTGYSLLDGTSYLYAENFELSSSKDGDIGSLVNVSGNSPLPSPLDPQDLEHSNIVGYTEMRDSIIIFEANPGHNNIWEYNKSTGFRRIIGDEDLQSGESLGFYQGMLADPNYRVTAVGSYESDTLQKIYWSDGVNPLRYLNIADLDIPKRIQDLNIVPIGTYDAPKKVKVIPGGKVKTGKIQYSYRLVNKYGSVSSYSSPSELLSITEKTPYSSGSYYGTSKNISSGKSVQVTIGEVDSSFDIIQLFSIHYGELHSVPVISLIKEVAIPKYKTEFILVDTGDVISERTLLDYISYGGRIFSANALASKENILYAGGIKEDQLENSLDCRAYSFNSGTDPSAELNLVGEYLPKTSTTPVASVSLQGVAGERLPYSSYFTMTSGNHGDFYIQTNKIRTLEGAVFSSSDFVKGVIRIVVTRNNSTGNFSRLDTPSVSFIRPTTPPTGGTVSYAPTFNSSSETTSEISFNIFERADSFSYIGFVCRTSTRPLPRDVNFTISIYVENLEILNGSSGGSSVNFSKLVNIAGETEAIIYGNNPDFNIPENLDCINPYTDVFNFSEKLSHDTENAYKYQSDGVTLGGSGKIVDFSFVDFNMSEEDLENSQNVDIIGNKYKLSKDGMTTILSSTKEDIINNIPGFKRGEVYRCGLQFFDVYGKPMFVNWIADIRVPYTFEWDSIPNSRYFYSSQQGGSLPYNMWATPIKIKFKVKLGEIPLDFIKKISGFKIVRAKRELHDRSVLMQGLCKPSFAFPNESKTGTDYYTPSLNASGVVGSVGDNYSKNLLDFHSPDIYANTAKINIPNSKGVVVGYVTSGEGIIDIDNVDKKITSLAYPPKNFPNVIEDGVSSIFPYKAMYSSFDIRDSISLNYKDTKDSLGYPIEYTVLAGTKKAVTFKNRPSHLVTNGANNTYTSSYGPTSAVLVSTSNPYQNALYTIEGNIIIDIVVDNFKSRYGGNSYFDKSRTEYISCSNFTSITEGNVFITTTGDTYTTLYSQMTGYADIADDSTSDWKTQGMFSIPIESTINCLMFSSKPSALLLDKAYTKLKTWGVQESRAAGIQLYPQYYPEGIKDLFEYNSVFSQQPIYPIYSPKPFLFEEESKNDTMVIASEKKISKELEDPWTKFLYSNLIELPTVNGPIRDLKTIESKLICWQDNAVTNISTNDRYVMSEGNAGQLALGSGSILERYDVIAENTGVQSLYAVVVHDNAFYWIDSKRKNIMNYGAQISNLSVAKGINKYLNSVGEFNHPTVGINRKKNKVYFRINNNNILSYNLELEVFEGIITSPTKWFIPLHDSSLIESNGNIHLHINGNGDKGNYYGVVNESLVEFVSSDKYLYTKSFDTLEWSSESSSITNTNIPPSVAGINKIQVYNDYQNTGDVNITPRKSERSYRIDIPRDSINSNESTPKNINDPGAINQSALFRRRILGKYAVIRLYHDNNGDYKIVIPYVNVNYRISYR